jgi:hypothetical protein
MRWSPPEGLPATSPGAATEGSVVVAAAGVAKATTACSVRAVVAVRRR